MKRNPPTPLQRVFRYGWIIPVLIGMTMYNDFAKNDCKRGRHGCPWDLPALFVIVPGIFLGSMMMDIKLDPEYRLANKKKKRYQELKAIHGETIAWKMSLDEFPLRGSTSS